MTNKKTKKMTELRKPKWLTSSKVGSKRACQVTKYLREYNLNTVCEDAKCPNRGECFDNGTATFMILGETCTRNCTFCAVDKTRNKLLPADINEPQAIAELSVKLGLKHLVVTTVTRDDLPDGGASQFVKVIHEVRKQCAKDVSIEVLISDLEGNLDALQTIVKAGPDVLNHNVETIARLYDSVRPMANYQQSLNVLKQAKKIDSEILTKSGFMVGLGESQDEVLELMRDLRQADVNIITIGQYLMPSRKHFQVVEYVHPDVFDFYRIEGERMGFDIVESSPLVRSSYHAEKARKLLRKRG